MSEDVNTSRTNIIESLELLEKIHIKEPSSFVLQVFFDAKSAEIVNIFSEANQGEKARVVKLLNKIDPANTTKYAKIVKNWLFLRITNKYEYTNESNSKQYIFILT